MENSSSPIGETWFIPLDILRIICDTLALVLAVSYLCIIIVDQACRTIPVLLIGNTCLIALVLGSTLLGNAVFTFQIDLQLIEGQDSLCIFRAYLGFSSIAIFNYSFLLQGLYRYTTVVYAGRLFWQSYRNQIILICISWIFGGVFSIPTVFIEMAVYNRDNQICQVALHRSFTLLYLSGLLYFTPVTILIVIYTKLVLYVRGMNTRIVSANVISRARRELRMLHRIVAQVSTLLVIGFPYAIFILMSLFVLPPTYHFRIAYFFTDVSLASVMITILVLTDPLRAFMLKLVCKQTNAVIPVVT